MEAEGWYRDPFGCHELRWFSVGRPNALVRDGAAEGDDPPPAPRWDGPLQDPAEGADGAGLAHAEGGPAAWDPQAARDAAFYWFDRSAGGDGGLV